MCCIAVHEKQVFARADLIHQPLHVARVSGEHAAAMTVDTNSVRHRGQRPFKGIAELSPAHIQIEP